ncbi:MAG: WD40 repeat domain-containing serine/threonine protein kinase [Thermoanaerobaculia bacterium]
MTLSDGTRLGPYEILSPVGAGGMGEVYRAKDPRLGRDVAIKVLPASVSNDPDRLKRFEQEARAAGVLNHPNVTIVYDIGQHDGAPYVVQELLEGETLRSELAGGRFSTRKAIDYAIQIAQGLSAAHEKGIVHRDLKPENLFVTREGRVKILDFGLAKLVQVEAGSASKLPTATEPGVVMGTLGYMSPEQIKGEPADGRSDIFAFGAVLYEMLSGRRAFEGGSTGEAMAAILKEDPPDLSATSRNVSPGLERLVRHCLEKSPERRFQSARDLAYDLETLTTVSGAAASTTALGAPSQRWRKPLLAAALLAVGVLAVWSVTRIRTEKPVSYRRITFRRGTVYSARFAPDGQTVVYSAAWEGQPTRIFATRVGSLESRQLPVPDGRVLAVSPTGELAIQIGHDSIWESTGTLARVALEGGAPRELLENVSRADWSPNGRELAVVHRVAGKYRVEFPIGKVLYEATDYIESIRFSPRGDRIAVGPFVGDVVCLDLAGKATTLTKGWSGVADVAWRPDGGEIWFVGERPKGKLALYGVTLSGRERTVRLEAAGLYLFDISRDGRALLNDYLWDSNLAAVASGETSEHELSWMDRSYVTAVSKEGRFVVFNEWGEGGGDNGAIYLRPLDGSAAVRLGEGWGLALSPDNLWVLSRPSDPSDPYVLLPTGPGEPRRLEHRGLTTVDTGQFLPDGMSILFLGRTGNGPLKAYIESLEGGEPRALSPDGLSAGSVAVSPEGRLFAAQGPDSKIAIYAMDGGPPKPVLGAGAGEIPILWSADGRSIYAVKTREAPALVFKINVATGARELWKTVAPADRSGLVAIDGIVMTPDARSYAYCYERILTSLQVVEGLR